MSSGQGGPSRRDRTRGAEQHARPPADSGRHKRARARPARAPALVAGGVACALLIGGCSTAAVPRDPSGVRTLYRGIGIDAGVGDPQDICRSYLAAPLRREVERQRYACLGTRVERWSEKVRRAKVKATTQIVVTGTTALIYDGTPPERAVYVSGRWLLADAPELTESRARASDGAGASGQGNGR